MLPRLPSGNFNPRSHERSDCRCEYQTTHCRYFNPRSHERSDDDISGALEILQISIHAPTRGATIKASATEPNFSISIHAPTRGATVRRSCCRLFFRISIHAPTRGATAILHKKFVYFYTIPTINI